MKLVDLISQIPKSVKAIYEKILENAQNTQDA